MKENYIAIGRPMRPEDVIEMLDRVRNCQRYRDTLPEGTIKEDLTATINLSLDFIFDIMREHGIEGFENMTAFEAGDFSKWRA